MRRVLLLLGLAVLVAGCTLQPPSDDGGDITLTPSDGLTATLEPSASSIVDGDSMVVELALQNTGGSTARVTAATLFGAAAFNGCVATRALDDPIVLNPAIPAADQIGGQTRLQWSCDSVSTTLGSGESDSFPVGAEFTYGYNTTARTSFTVVRPGETASGSGQGTSNTAGPVHATIGVADPARVDDGAVSLPITITNVGDGDVVGDVSLAASTPQSAGTVEQCPETVSLIEGRRDVLCRISFNRAPSSGTQVLVAVEMDYAYTERASSSVRISR